LQCENTKAKDERNNLIGPKLVDKSAIQKNDWSQRFQGGTTDSNSYEPLGEALSLIKQEYDF
jgi:hypothetical protein